MSPAEDGLDVQALVAKVEALHVRLEGVESSARQLVGGGDPAAAAGGGGLTATLARLERKLDALAEASAPAELVHRLEALEGAAPAPREALLQRLGALEAALGEQQRALADLTSAQVVGGRVTAALAPGAQQQQQQQQQQGDGGEARRRSVSFADRPPPAAAPAAQPPRAAAGAAGRDTPEPRVFGGGLLKTGSGTVLGRRPSPALQRSSSLSPAVSGERLQATHGPAAASNEAVRRARAALARDEAAAAARRAAEAAEAPLWLTMLTWLLWGAVAAAGAAAVALGAVAAAVKQGRVVADSPWDLLKKG